MHFSFYGSLSYSSGQQSLYVMLFNVVNKPGDCWHNWLLQQLHVLNTQSNSCSSHHSNAASIRQVDIITNICCTLLHPIMTSRAYSKMTACYCKLIYITSPPSRFFSNFSWNMCLVDLVYLTVCVPCIACVAEQEMP